MAKRDVKPRRFWQCDRSLKSVLWDAKKGVALVRFKRGTALVTDDAIAQKLLSLGYIEIPLDRVEVAVPLDESRPNPFSVGPRPGITAKAPELLTDGLEVPKELMGCDSNPGSFTMGG